MQTPTIIGPVPPGADAFPGYGQITDLGPNWRIKFADADGIPLNMLSFEQIDFGAIAFKEIFQNVKTILATPLYSAALERLLGVDQTLVDRPITDAATATVAVLDALYFWEPRAQAVNIAFDADVINGHLICKLQLNIQNVIYGTDTPYDRNNVFETPTKVVQQLPPEPIMPPPKPTVIPDPLFVQTIYIGSNMRIVSLPNGGKIEVFDGTNWIEQVDYTEGTAPT